MRGIYLLRHCPAGLIYYRCRNRRCLFWECRRDVEKRLRQSYSLARLQRINPRVVHLSSVSVGNAWLISSIDEKRKVRWVADLEWSREKSLEINDVNDRLSKLNQRESDHHWHRSVDLREVKDVEENDQGEWIFISPTKMIERREQPVR